MTDTTGPKIRIDNKIDRKRRRIERELRALRAMQSHLNIKDIVCAVLAIPALALVCLVAAAKLHIASGSGPLAFGVALAGGVLIWWIGRRWFWLAVMIVYGLLLLAFETSFDVPDWGGDKNPKMSRAEKLQRAIAKREAMLNGMKP